MNSPAVEKAALRRAARELRRALADPAVGLALPQLYPGALAGRSPVAGYWPLGSELDSRPLLLWLLQQGAEVLLPRMLERDLPPLFLPWRPETPLSPDAFGILAPAEGAPIAPALILAPLLAFDRAGGRLGQGGGHYDRVLAALKPQGVLAVGLAYAGQELPAIPREPHDQTLDWVLTEREAIRCG